MTTNKKEQEWSTFLPELSQDVIIYLFDLVVCINTWLLVGKAMTEQYFNLCK